jgi:hypothetical protein
MNIIQGVTLTFRNFSKSRGRGVDRGCASVAQ